GSGTDLVARAIGQAMGSETPAVRVVVDNKPGANGFIGAQAAAKATPDGYTIFVTTNTTQSAAQHLYKKLPYDPVADFVPVAGTSKGSMFVLVPANSPFQTFSDVIAEARKTPDKLSFGSGSSSSRVAGELLKQMAHINLTHVPYKSNPLGLPDLMAGRLDLMFIDAPTALPQVSGGKLRALAYTGAQRSRALPNVPTVNEAGVKGYELSY